MASGIETGKEFAAFFNGKPDWAGEFGINTKDSSTLDGVFGISGLSKVISATYHLAEWKMVFTEYIPVNGKAVRGFGLDLTAGPPEQEIKLRYFPESRPGKRDLLPKQLSRLYLTSNGNNLLQLENSYLVITGCEVINGSVIFNIYQPKKYGENIPTEVSISPRDGRCEVKYADRKSAPVQTVVSQPELF